MSSGHEHFNFDGIFKKAEVLTRKVKVTEMENDKKLREVMDSLAIKVQTILEQKKKLVFIMEMNWQYW